MASAFRFEDLLEIVNRHSRGAVLQAEGCRILVSERGARILGIFMEDFPNPLWVNPELDEAFSSGDWNIGGLRLWISPERNFFYRRPEVFEEWFCPEGIDPGKYRVARIEVDRVALEGEISAYDNLTKSQLNAQVYREFRLAEAKRGYVRLRITEAMLGDYPGRVNPWILAQVPVGYGGAGTVLVPVKRGAEPIHYFTEIPKDRLKVSADHISFKIDGEYVSKLGVKPEDLKTPNLGEIAYVARVGRGLWSALILRSHHIPSSQEDCLDVPKRDPNLPRAAVQSYNSGPEAFKDVRFGEIEIQLAPTASISGKIFTRVEYDVVACAGGREEVLSKIRRILRIAKPKLY